MNRVNFIIGTLSTGGAERTVSSLSMYLNKNILTNIILFGKNAKVGYSYHGRLTYLDKADPNGMFSKIQTFLKRCKAVRSKKKSDSNSLFISFLEYPNLINVVTGLKKNVVISVRNHMSTKHKKGIKAFFWNCTIKYLYPRASKIIACSEEIKLDLIENYKIPSNKIKVIYNSYNFTKIRKESTVGLEKRQKEIFNNPTIITVGRLNKQKGYEHLIRILPHLKSYFPSLQLVFLGEGEEYNTLKRLCEKLGIEESTHFMGFQDNVFKFVAKSKVFVMTSLYEGFPNALAEAMACGVPVISTDCPSGPREILAPDEFKKNNLDYKIARNRFGILIPNFSEEGLSLDASLSTIEKKLANSIYELLSTPALIKHFEKQSINRVQDFDIKKTIKEWELLIQNEQ